MSTNTFAPVQPKGAPKKWNGVGKGASIAAIGAGSFGGWTAYHLLKAGYRVTLIDAWGPGNSRSSSGDETRVIRSTYGANEFYFDLNVRALELWQQYQKAWGKQLFYNNGVIWFCYDEKAALVDDSLPFAQKHNMNYEYLSKADLQKRFPIVNTDDLHHAYLDPFGGYLKARESCQAVFDAFVREGGKFVLAHASVNKNNELELSNGEKVTADLYIYACGPWLGKLFPNVLSNTITCTRQEAYYFGTPAQAASLFNEFPAWIDLDGQDFYYGIPGNAHRGFKIGVDRRGESFDPTTGDRILNPSVLAHARNFIGHRFPLLKDAPLAESRVCPYENSPDGNFLLDHHPESDRIWFLGGGSGHGFKHGPALGELVAGVVEGTRALPSFFAMSKL